MFLEIKRYLIIKVTFFDLDYLGNADEQVPRLLDGINNPSSKRRFYQLSENFKKIPGSPIAYWVSERLTSIFNDGKKLKEFSLPRQGMSTTTDVKHLRYWFENKIYSISFTGLNDKGWYPYNKGGDFRKWFGNIIHTVNYSNGGEDLIELVRKKYPNISDPELNKE